MILVIRKTKSTARLIMIVSVIVFANVFLILPQQSLIFLFIEDNDY